MTPYKVTASADPVRRGVWLFMAELRALTIFVPTGQQFTEQMADDEWRRQYPDRSYLDE